MAESVFPATRQPRRRSIKLLYKPFGLLVGVIGGRAAASSFNRLWRLIDSDGPAPSATDRDNSWRQVVIASALKGAVFGVVKASTDRAGATWFAYLTGTWPGKESAKPKASPSPPRKRPGSGA